jgi:hypothetical protein
MVFLVLVGLCTLFGLAALAALFYLWLSGRDDETER